MATSFYFSSSASHGWIMALVCFTLSINNLHIRLEIMNDKDDTKSEPESTVIMNWAWVSIYSVSHYGVSRVSLQRHTKPLWCVAWRIHSLVWMFGARLVYRTQQRLLFYKWFRHNCVHISKLITKASLVMLSSHQDFYSRSLIRGLSLLWLALASVDNGYHFVSPWQPTPTLSSISRVLAIV